MTGIKDWKGLALYSEMAEGPCSRRSYGYYPGPAGKTGSNQLNRQGACEEEAIEAVLVNSRNKWCNSIIIDLCTEGGNRVTLMSKDPASVTVIRLFPPQSCDGDPHNDILPDSIMW